MTTLLLLSGIFLTSFVVALSGALMPGPLLTITIAQTPRHGIWTGPLLIAGHAILEILMIFLLLIGLGQFLKTSFAIALIGLGGALVMLLIAKGLFHTAHSLEWKNTAAENNKISRTPLISGILASLANPYWTLWWVSIGLAYITQATQLGLPGITVFFLGHISADFLWYFFISFSLTKGQRFISDKTYHLIMKGCGALLIFFGGWFGYTGIKAGLTLFN